MSTESPWTAPVGARALLVGVQLPGTTEAELQASLDELARLAKTLGLDVIGRLTQARQDTRAPAVLGQGKLVELARFTGGTGVVPSGAPKRKGADGGDESPEAEVEAAEEALAEALALPAEERAQVVLFDHDLTPSQLRNLEGATGAEVLDRTSVILSIFQRHARTREARLQVEIARLAYLAPRLRATGAGAERQRGGIGGKGAGESALELDRRRVRDRIAELRHELVSVQRESDLRRTRRARRDTLALVGYTNAGKSSLMRALTGSEVYVQDQLFATLDTTVRVLQPETRPRLLVSDTVGFIKKLPHDLVASFRSTLAEARDAALLLHIVDAADPAWRSQLQVTLDVLGELGAGDTPSLLVFNKADLLDDAARQALLEERPDAFIISAREPADVAALRERIVAFFERDMEQAELFVPYRQQKLVHTTHEAAKVLSETHEDEGTRLRILAPPQVIAELREALRGK
ncbi:MAG: GTPase HflX [Deltaproteobacteria bacterium]|nr:GTPase HflX [Deltaproteobacteria bacterium]MCB9786645.1 GTPase HflX [Deltaproteobacteria bacterium]